MKIWVFCECRATSISWGKLVMTAFLRPLFVRATALLEVWYWLAFYISGLLSLIWFIDSKIRKSSPQTDDEKHIWSKSAFWPKNAPECRGGIFRFSEIIYDKNFPCKWKSSSAARTRVRRALQKFLQTGVSDVRKLLELTYS